MYVAEVVKSVLKHYPIIGDRQQQEMDAMRDQIALLQAAITDLQAQNSKLTAANKEYRQWETQMREHIASVDQKAEGLETLQSLVYVIWDVVMQWLEPKVKEAKWIIKTHRYIEAHGPQNRGRYDLKE